MIMLKTVQCTDSFCFGRKKMPKWEEKVDEFVLYIKQNDEILKFVHKFYQLFVRNDL